jgi:clan AA aspartic protease (TIGR02281 family)
MRNFITTFALLIFSIVSNGQTAIIMQKEGGVFTIPCTVNGLKLNFIFDTGASDVSISLTEALFMLKNGYLSANEIYGSSYAQIANGDITENTKILLKKIEFAGFTLYNVTATVIHSTSAPLLFGQSAMAKLGKFQIDPNTGTLTVMNSTNSSYDYNNKPSNSTSDNTSTSTTYRPSKPQPTPPAPDTRASMYGINDYYLKLPTYTGKVKVYDCASIYDEPDINSRVKGQACNGKVKIMWKENIKWYYVNDGKTKGYLSVDVIKKDKK